MMRTLKAYLPSLIVLGKPFSQPLGESHGRSDKLSESFVVAQPAKPKPARISRSTNKYRA